jgi:hypothetical protein
LPFLLTKPRQHVTCFETTKYQLPHVGTDKGRVETTYKGRHVPVLLQDILEVRGYGRPKFHKGTNRLLPTNCSTQNFYELNDFSRRTFDSRLTERTSNL